MDTLQVHITTTPKNKNTSKSQAKADKYKNRSKSKGHSTRPSSTPTPQALPPKKQEQTMPKSVVPKQPIKSTPTPKPQVQTIEQVKQKLEENSEYTPYNPYQQTQPPPKIEYQQQDIDNTFFEGAKVEAVSQPDPSHSVFSAKLFEELNISERLKKSLEKSNIKRMTKVQQAGIPEILNKKSIAIKSETGSGKTMTYLIPILSALASKPQQVKREDGVYSVVLCPSRELCMQIQEQATLLTKSLIWIVPGAIMGGENPQKEKSRIRKGINILIATPGRLLYHLKNTECLDFRCLESFVFEEADRTLDMGFRRDVECIIELIQKKSQFNKVQKILISATYSYKVKQLQKTVLKENYLKLVGFQDQQNNNEGDSQSEGEQEGHSLIPKSLTQNYVVIEENEKISFLLCYLKQLSTNKVVLFVSTIDEVEFLGMVFEQMSYRDSGDQITSQRILSQEIYKLHGDVEQKDRTKIYFDYKKTKKAAVLIATEVASRGLDFDQISHSVLLDPPSSLSDYINKVGRTARIDKKGVSLLVLLECERAFVNELDQKRIQIEGIQKMEYFGKMKKCLETEWQVMNQNVTYYVQGLLKYILNISDENYYLARRAYNSFIRAYCRLPNKDIFNVHNINLYQLGKCFGMNKVQSRDKETTHHNYKDNMLKRQTPQDIRNNTQPKQKKWLEKRKVLNAGSILKNYPQASINTQQ